MTGTRQTHQSQGASIRRVRTPFRPFAARNLLTVVNHYNSIRGTSASRVLRWMTELASVGAFHATAVAQGGGARRETRTPRGPRTARTRDETADRNSDRLRLLARCRASRA